MHASQTCQNWETGYTSSQNMQYKYSHSFCHWNDNLQETTTTEKRNSFFFLILHFDKQDESESEKARRHPAPRATAVLQTFLILFPLCHTKILLFNIQVDLQIAFLYESLSLWLWPPQHFHQGQEFNCKWNPEKFSPAPQRDRMPSHCSRSMGAAGIVGTAWPCSSQSTQSRSCLIQGLSPSMFLCSETSDNAKLPWQ